MTSNISFFDTKKNDLYFSQETELGALGLVEINENNVSIIHEWVKLPYAAFWGMSLLDQKEINEYYLKLAKNNDHTAYLGTINNKPRFLIELYKPEKDEVGKCYSVQNGDIGMHILLCPAEKVIKDFSFTVFNFVMEAMFSLPGVKRIVVEPDAENNKIHTLNKRAGFQHIKTVQFPQGGKLKTALLGFCTKQQFEASKLNAFNLSESTQTAIPHSAVKFIQPEIWQQVNHHLVVKCLSEFSHERILQPKFVEELNNGWSQYQVISPSHQTHYLFKAKQLPLDYWLIDSTSLVKIVEKKNTTLDALQFIIEFNTHLNIPQDKLPVYLEEISATLYSAAYKYAEKDLPASEVAMAPFQTIEAAMTEGHPCFIANNGRIGFDAIDYSRYAPECGKPVKLLFLAAHKERATFKCCSDISYEDLLEQEFDYVTRQQWQQLIITQNANPDDYWIFPVHPWQWNNKLTSLFAAEIASKNLIVLGYSDDVYQAQQSIRTFFNLTDNNKYYVKTAISVLNMGFMRGLSAGYMKVTPAINDWLQSIINDDPYFEKVGYKILREIASVGYSCSYFDHPEMKTTPYNKMLAALWRENPMCMIDNNQRLMTMAALLHSDQNGESLIAALIENSALSTTEWLTQYLNAYLKPLLHCFYKYKLVYMPHGENVILIIEDNVPVGIFMKDIGEEICILNSDIELPDNVARISIELPENHELLSFFTDVFDCFFRFLTATLEEKLNFSSVQFWQLVAQCIKGYQKENPEFTELYEKYDLFMDKFDHSCLNRLQLANNLQMVDLTAPSSALQFAGKLKNPLSKFSPTTIKSAEIEKEAM